MTTISATPQKSAVSEAPSPTVTHYEQLAAELSIAIDTAAADIPNIESPHPSTLDFVRSHQLSNAFIASVIAAVEATPELQSINKFNVAEARDTLQFSDAFAPLSSRITVLARRLTYTMRVRRARISADALQMYEIAKAVARDPNSAGLSAHVEEMRRALGRGRPRPRKTPVPTPETPSPEKPST
jgi:hypothetical protein